MGEEEVLQEAEILQVALVVQVQAVLLLSVPPAEVRKVPAAPPAATAQETRPVANYKVVIVASITQTVQVVVVITVAVVAEVVVLHIQEAERM